MGKVELKVEIDAELLRRAREAGLDLSTAFESELRRRFPEPGMRDRGRDWATEPAPTDTPEARSAKWAEENAEAIAEHNAWIAKHGLVGDDWRKW